MRPRLLPPAVLAVLAACAAPTPEPPTPLPPTPSPVRCTLLPGSLLVLREPTANGDPVAPPRILRMWWRECMVQSVDLDVAPQWTDGTPEDTGAHALRLHVDGTARVASATLERPDGSTLLVAQQSLGSFSDPVAAARALATGLDQLAWMCRTALGDRVEPRPVGCLSTTSTNLDAVVALERGLDALQDGMPAEGIRFLQLALRMDPGSPLAVDGLAACHLLRGEGELALRTLERTVASGRTSNVLRQRMARSRLLARASANPAEAATCDAALLALGTADSAARPHDAQARLTVAVAHNLRGDFSTAEPLLAGLRLRMPANALAAVHHGWALLAAGRPHEARRALADAEARMPAGSLVVPRALALCEDGDRDGFERLVADAVEGTVEESVARFDLVRMLDAEEMLAFPPERDGSTSFALSGRDVARITNLCTWLLQRPSLLESRIGPFTEMAVVALSSPHAGPAADLADSLTAAGRSTGTPPAVAASLRFLDSLQTVLRGGTVPPRPTDKDRDELVRWLRVRAASQRRAGDLAAEAASLREALELAASPAVQAELVRSLRTAGRTEEATRELVRLRGQLRGIRLRDELLHPATGPERAAWWNGLLAQ